MKDISLSVEKNLDRVVALLSCDAVVKCLACSVVIVLLSNSFGADPDLFARVAVGRLIERLGYLPAQDPFAFTPKNPQWIDHEWLSGVVFYQLVTLGGDPLLFGFKLGMACLTLLVLLRAARTWSPEATPTPIWTLICVMHGIFAWMSSVRCQVFTYLFVAVLLLTFTELWKAGARKYMFVVPAMMMVWCNLHGGFIVGFGLLGVATATSIFYFRKSFLPLLLTTLLSLAVTALNPYGFSAYWGYIIHAITMPRPAIEEWAPVSITDVNGMPMLVFVLFLLIGLARLKRINSAPREYLPALAFLTVGFFFGFRHIRLIPFATSVSVVFGPVFFYQCGLLFKELAPRYFEISYRVSRIFLASAGLISCLIAAKVVIGLPFVSLDYTSYPVKALAWLKHNTSGGKLLVDFNNGSFALWKLYPQFSISMDGRYEEVYPESTNLLVAKAYQFGTSEGATALATVDPDYILIPPYASRKDYWTTLSPNWQSIYSDEQFRVLGRVVPAKSAAPLPDSAWVGGF